MNHSWIKALFGVRVKTYYAIVPLPEFIRSQSIHYLEKRIDINSTSSASNFETEFKTRLKSILASPKIKSIFLGLLPIRC
jgi:hypothetical protein